MTTDASPTPQTAAAEPSIKDLTQRFAFLLALEGAVKDLTIAARRNLGDRLVEVAEEMGTKSFVARDFEGEPMATFSLRETKPKFVVSDPDAFYGYVQVNYPFEVEVVFQVKQSFAKELLTAKKLDGDTDGVVDRATGELVPGVTYVPGGEGDGFGTSWTKTNGEDTGKRAALAQVLTRPPLELGIGEE